MPICHVPFAGQVLHARMLLPKNYAGVRSLETAFDGIFHKLEQKVYSIVWMTVLTLERSMFLLYRLQQ